MSDVNDGHFDFIEIGTSDFDTLIEDASESTRGISIEPIKYYLDRLPNKENVIDAVCEIMKEYDPQRFTFFD